MKVKDICEKLIFIPGVDIVPVRTSKIEKEMIVLQENENTHTDSFTIVPQMFYDLDVLWLFPSTHVNSEGTDVKIKPVITLVVDYDQYEAILKKPKKV